jgi:hypothetical protein
MPSDIDEEATADREAVRAALMRSGRKKPPKAIDQKSNDTKELPPNGHAR